MNQSGPPPPWTQVDEMLLSISSLMRNGRHLADGAANPQGSEVIARGHYVTMYS